MAKCKALTGSVGERVKPPQLAFGRTIIQLYLLTHDKTAAIQSSAAMPHAGRCPRCRCCVSSASFPVKFVGELLVRPVAAVAAAADDTDGEDRNTPTLRMRCVHLSQSKWAAQSSTRCTRAARATIGLWYRAPSGNEDFKQERKLGRWVIEPAYGSGRREGDTVPARCGAELLINYRRSLVADSVGTCQHCSIYTAAVSVVRNCWVMARFRLMVRDVTFAPGYGLCSLLPQQLLLLLLPDPLRDADASFLRRNSNLQILILSVRG